MKSPEGFTPPQAKIETTEVEKELQSKSPEIKVEEIKAEQVEQYADMAESQVEQTKTEVLLEVERKIESSAQSMDVSLELLNSAKQEQNLDVQLNEIQIEANQIAGETKREIEAIRQPVETLPENVEAKQELADVIDNDSRYQAIEKELSDKALKKSINILKRMGKTESEALFHMEVFGSARKHKDGSLRMGFEPWKIHQEFAQRYPEEYKQYQKKEKSRVYWRAHDDPAYAEANKKVYEAEDKYMPWDIGHEYRGYTSHESIGKLEEARKSEWDNFVAQYPEKAALYGKYDKNIEAALKRKERNANKQKNLSESAPIKIGQQEQTNEAAENGSSRFSEVFEQAGIESKVVKVEDGGEFSEVIILEKKEIPTEKLTRLYRGINHMDGSVLEQTPYAMRTENGTGKPTTLESVRQEVDALAKNPTYENLIAYTDKVRSNLTPEEVGRFNEDLKRIEDGILDGYSTRKELTMRQIEHGGGWGESGISPYVSSSFDPYEAAGYGREGLIVMDVPFSQIQDFRADATETNIKGALDKKYITAILTRRREGEKEKEQVNQELYRALQKVYENAPGVLYEDEELRAEREKIQTEQTELDKEQWEKDVEKVRQKRVGNLTRRFPEVKLDVQSAAEQGVDIYTKAKRDIFDFYKVRLEKIGRNGRNIEDYEYQESDYSERKKFDRENANDIMLLKLKTLVQRLEEREEERKRNR